MTKRAVLIGLAMAAAVLVILFVFFRPDTTQAPAPDAADSAPTDSGSSGL